MEAQAVDTFARVEAAFTALQASDAPTTDDFPPASAMWGIVQALEADLDVGRTIPHELFRKVALGPLGGVAVRQLPMVSGLVERGRVLFELVRAVPALADRVPPFARLLELMEEHEELFEQIADVRALAAMSPEDREVATAADLA